MSKYIPMIIMFAASLTIVLGCKDDDGANGVGELKMFLVDTPASYDSVVLVVKELSVCSERHGWIVMESATRTFGRVELMNGAPSLFGEASLEAGRYTQIRVIPDTGSYVVVNGRRRPIAIPGGLEKSITLAHRFQVDANLQNIMYVDFDANGNACTCTCCGQFTARLHASMNLETPGIYVQRRLKMDRGLERCKCSDRWDHRQESGQRCRHCISKNNRVSAIG